MHPELELEDSLLRLPDGGVDVARLKGGTVVEKGGYQLRVRVGDGDVQSYVGNVAFCSNFGH